MWFHQSTMAPTTAGSRDKSKVLIIDDEEVVRMLFQNLLEDEGYAALLAQDGQSGIEIIDSQNPQLVLVDKNLPDVSGLELISSQKKQHPNTEFIMITGYASLDSALKALEAGAFSYLTKPFSDMNVVLDRIKAALEVNHLREETSQLRNRLNNLASPKPAAASPARPGLAAPARTLAQIQHTISLLESIISKREQPPTPPIWARWVDMMEEECRRLKQILEGEKPI